MARVARGEDVEVIGNVNSERFAVRSIAWLGLMGSIFIASDSPMVHPGQKGRAF
jgi:hypothetical protein